MKKIEKPGAGEYAPYTIRYIGLLPDDGLVPKHLEDNLKVTNDFMSHRRPRVAPSQYYQGALSVIRACQQII
ncbi:MAG TPA: hypothetical protein VGC91_08900 [Pyrinomonadaceae bacterium]|jgi:hypothetical protein